MKYLPFLFCVCLIFSCKNKPQPPTETPESTADDRLDFSIIPGERAGLITSKNCSPEAILKSYGDLGTRDSVYLGEGIWEDGVVLFPNNTRNRVEIFWEKEFSEKYPAFIRMMGDSTGSDWKTKKGVTIGTSLEEVQKMNGAPFSIFGFGWDYGGWVTDWENGHFTNSLRLRFFPTGPGDESIAGEQTLSSDNPNVMASRPVVKMLDIAILAKEILPDCIYEKVNNYAGRGRMSVRKMSVGEHTHFWLNDGAAAYDGIEMVYNENCEEVCKFGGFRKPLECMKAYENRNWELIWEE